MRRGWPRFRECSVEEPALRRAARASGMVERPGFERGVDATIKNLAQNQLLESPEPREILASGTLRRWAERLQEVRPNRGRAGRVAGTRELVFAPPPFVAVYDVHD